MALREVSERGSQGSTAGRFYVAPSPFASIVSGLTSVGSGYMAGKADREQEKFETDQKSMLAKALSAMAGGSLVDPQSAPSGMASERVEPSVMKDPSQTPVMLRGLQGSSPQQPPVNPQMEAAMSVLRGLPIEQQQAIIGNQAASRLFPKPQEGFTLAPGQARYEGGKQVASMPAAESKADTGFSLSPGQTRFDAVGKPVANVAAEPPKPEQPTPTQLVTRPGPNGMLQDYAFDPRTKQFTPVAEPYAKQAPLSPKDTSTVKQKLTQIGLARQQIQMARDKFKALEGTFSAGIGGGLLPTESGKAFDAAIDGMRGTISSITRVPGIGAMSDFETRLDQSKFPTRGEYESVQTQKLDQLDALLKGLEGGYADMLGGASDVASPDAPAGAPPVGTVEAGYRFKGGNPADPASWEKTQ